MRKSLATWLGLHEKESGYKVRSSCSAAVCKMPTTICYHDNYLSYVPYVAMKTTSMILSQDLVL